MVWQGVEEQAQRQEQQQQGLGLRLGRGGGAFVDRRPLNLSPLLFVWLVLCDGKGVRVMELVQQRQRLVQYWAQVVETRRQQGQGQGLWTEEEEEEERQRRERAAERGTVLICPSVLVWCPPD